MNALAVPIPTADVSVREATLDDIPFIDQLQKLHREGVGFMHRGTLEGKIAAREVLVAEGPLPEGPLPGPLPGGEGERLGYIIHKDRYLKRDELGVIFQLCVAQGEQRKLVGATLVREAFARSAYGCRLYCLWCAQDLDANYFWESLGFVPIAFRAGSAKKRRVHIFWQKRIREGDHETKWWYPCQTSGGAIGDDRLVFPIPPGKHWRDDMPMILPKPQAALTDARATRPRAAKNVAPPSPKHVVRQFGGPSDEPVLPTPAPVAAEKPRREKKPKVKCDPKHIALARELRDRWSEHVNAGQAGGASIESAGKYDLTRVLPETPVKAFLKQLPLAA
jgi:hypothetical protein